MKLILEFDDFHHNKEVNCIDHVIKLISKYPDDDIVVNLFSIPIYNGVPISKDKSWCRDVSDLVKAGKVCIAVHGTNHTQEEFKNIPYPTAYFLLDRSRKEFNEAGIDFVKAFRGPHWGICRAAVDALIVSKYTHIYNHTKYSDLENIFHPEDDITFVHYNWNLKDDFGVYENELTNDIIVAHGHTSNVCGNGIQERFDSIINGIDILKSTGDLEFLKVTDYKRENT